TRFDVVLPEEADPHEPEYLAPEPAKEAELWLVVLPVWFETSVVGRVPSFDRANDKGKGALTVALTHDGVLTFRRFGPDRVQPRVVWREPNEEHRYPEFPD